MIRTLITGAAGSVGKSLTLQLLKEGQRVCAFDNSEDALFKLRKSVKDKNLDENLRDFLGDIRDLSRLRMALKGCDEVYHCAALKHVGICEYNPFEAIQTNILGTNNVVSACIQENIKKVILTSSDKAVNPTSMMGASKLVAEKNFIAANNITGLNQTKFGVVRFGNVWNTNGSVGRIFLAQINNNKDLTITDKNMTRFFIKMQDALDLCRHAMRNLIGGEIFTRSMGAISIGDLAEAFLKNKPNLTFKIIGRSNGEKLYEELFTEFEAARSYKENDTYITIPERYNFGSNLNEQIELKYNNAIKCKYALRSDSPEVENIDPNFLLNETLDL